MVAYRIPEFTLEQRADTVLQMLNTDRKWGGWVSELAGLYGASCTLLCKMRDRA
jgi:hypothetical protein